MYYNYTDQKMASFIKLTPQNVNQYVGYTIVFKTRNEYITKKIIKANEKSIKIDHPNLKNNLQIITRDVYVIIE